MSYDCFISYAAADVEAATSLHERLTRAGFNVWFDRARLQAGYDWHREIEAACEASRVVMPVLTPRWKLSRWTRYETYGAEQVIPLVAEGKWEEVSTPPLGRFQALSIGDDGLFMAIRRLLSEPVPEKAPRMVRVQYLPNPYFVGREETLTEIHEKLHRNPTTALTQGRVEAVTALGGVGKTTIAREYAEKFWRCYRQIFWVDCRAGIEAEFSGLLDLGPQLKQTERAELARKELNRYDARNLRLLILDNAENEEAVIAWIPRTGNCHTLITSRFTDWSAGIERHPVWVLEEGPARELLMRRAGREAADEACDEVAKKLGYLPLALEQAGAYVGKQGAGFGFTDYLKLWDKSQRELLARRSRGGTEYPDAVYTTWRTTIERLPGGARAMLRLSSFLAPTPIPVKMFVIGAAKASEFQVREWKDALVDYSMATAQPDDAFSVHVLVQAVERHEVDAAERGTWVERVVSALGQRRSRRTDWVEQIVKLMWDYGPRPSYEYANWAVWKVLASHGQALLQAIGSGECSVTGAGLLNQLAQYAWSQGEYAAAEPLYRRALEVHERVLGPEHPSTLTSIQGLATLLDSQGDCSAAELLYRRALEAQERVLGPEDPSTLTSIQGLALLLVSQGDYDAAEPLYRRALEAWERVLGPEQPRTLISVNNLAELLRQKGDYDAAEPLYRRALEAQERVLGPEHPDTLSSVNNLSALLESKGDYAPAELLLRRALKAWERVLGPQHRDTLSAVNNLALLLNRKGDYAAAEPMYRRALEGFERVLGHDHPDTLMLVHNLADLLHKKGAYADAEALYRRALEAQGRVLGLEHPDTLMSVNNLARLLESMGEYAAAEPLSRRALEGCERFFGIDHPNTRLVRDNLEKLLRKLRSP